MINTNDRPIVVTMQDIFPEEKRSLCWATNVDMIHEGCRRILKEYPSFILLLRSGDLRRNTDPKTATLSDIQWTMEPVRMARAVILTDKDGGARILKWVDMTIPSEPEFDPIRLFRSCL